MSRANDLAETLDAVMSYVPKRSKDFALGLVDFHRTHGYVDRQAD